MRYNIIRLRSIITMAVLNLLKFLINDRSQSVYIQAYLFLVSKMSEQYHTTNMYYQKSGTKTLKKEQQ